MIHLRETTVAFFSGIVLIPEHIRTSSYFHLLY